MRSVCRSLRVTFYMNVNSGGQRLGTKIFLKACATGHRSDEAKQDLVHVFNYRIILKSVLYGNFMSDYIIE